MSYNYEVFISYHRSTGSAGTWVREFFYPRLEDAMADLLPLPPRIYIDKQTGTGTSWPAHLQHALSSSKLLVSVWNAPYTQSEWCWRELMTMRAREEALGFCAINKPEALVHVVRFCDGDAFPREYHERWSRADFVDFAHTSSAFLDSPKYLEFEDAVVRLATELVLNLRNAPSFDPGFPVVDECELPPVPTEKYPDL